MGNASSKPRKLSKQITDTASKSVNRSSSVNQLSSQSLKQRFEKSQEPPKQNPSLQPPKPEDISSTFNPEFLTKKLSNKLVPEGKDGFDPQLSGTSTYDGSFVQSINDLGKQIHSHSISGKSADSLALKQLRFRKELFAKGQAEEKSNSDGKTLVSPTTLTAILNDLYDPRFSNQRIQKDYQLSDKFLTELGQRFKVANNVVIIEEKLKEGEIGHRVTSPGSMASHGEDDDYGDAANSERMKSLKGRISLDD